MLSESFTLRRRWARTKTKSALAAAVYAPVGRRAIHRSSANSSAATATADTHALSACRALARCCAPTYIATREVAETSTLYGFAAGAEVIALAMKFAEVTNARNCAMAIALREVGAFLPATSALRPTDGLGLSWDH